MMSGDDVLMMSSARRVEVYTGAARRRRWSAEDKARIVAESHAVGVGETAARYGLAKNQVFAWRRGARQAAGQISFARVELEAAPAAEVGGVIEVRLGIGEVRVPPGADARLVTTILMALRPVR
jgi:transposase